MPGTAASSIAKFLGKNRNADGLLLSRAVVKPSVLGHPNPVADEAPRSPQGAEAGTPTRLGVLGAEAEPLVPWLPPAFVHGQG